MTKVICNECETVAHCLKNGCVPKTTKKDETMKLSLINEAPTESTLLRS